MPFPNDLTTYLQENRLSNNIVKMPGVDTFDIFSCELFHPMNPSHFAINILSEDKPWKAVAIPQKKSPHTSHWIVYIALLHIHNGNITETSPVVLDLTPRQITFSIPFSATSHRVAEFIHTIDSNYGITNFTTKDQQVKRQEKYALSIQQ